jgi:hypothetical protein
MCHFSSALGCDTNYQLGQRSSVQARVRRRRWLSIGQSGAQLTLEQLAECYRSDNMHYPDIKMRAAAVHSPVALINCPVVGVWPLSYPCQEPCQPGSLPTIAQTHAQFEWACQWSLTFIRRSRACNIVCAAVEEGDGVCLSGIP